MNEDDESCTCLICQLCGFIAETWIEVEVTGIEELPDKEKGGAPERRRP